MSQLWILKVVLYLFRWWYFIIKLTQWAKKNQQIFETLEVHSSILDIDLVHEIKQKLLQPLQKFCHAIPFNIDTMVLHETTKGKWKEVQVDKQRPLVYFGDCFLKPSKKKSDPTPIFNAGPPQTFGLVFPKDVWDRIQAQEGNLIYQFTNFTFLGNMFPQ